MKSIIKSLTILFILIIATNCDNETEVPETDTTPPTFALLISGDGFLRTFTQDDDFENIRLNLRVGESYDFLLRGSDDGGVRQIQFQFIPDNTVITTDIPSPWIEQNNELSTVVVFNGSSENPIRTQLLGGSFTAVLGNEQSAFVDFFIRVEDFGGESGPPFNITENILNIVIGDHDTEVVNR